MFGKIGTFLGLKKGNSKDVNISDIENSKILVVDRLSLTSKDDLDGFFVDSKINKSSLNKNDFKDFIGELDLEEGLVDRKFYNLDDSNIRESGYFFNERINDVDILTAIDKKDKIVILGNPGLGKTTELERLALNVWYDDTNEYIPIYKNLKNFTVQDTINSYLITEWKSLNKILFIFDGLDEIQNIQDFTSKLETFISNLDKYEVNYRIVVSCRTNVYESIVKSITDFSLYYLRDLTFNEGLSLLKQRCNLSVEESSFDDSYEGFLKNPFLVGIVSTYINVNNGMPNSTSELWESYINERLTFDEEEKLKKQTINPPLIKAYSKKVSLVNELMKTNVFTEDNLFRLVKNNSTDFEEFKKSPLIDKQKGKPVWFFEHRNIQEYFAALTISKKDFKDILEFIQINDTARTHPSLFNTITFLINLLDKETDRYKDLVNWFVDNEPELLFRADFDRVSPDIKEKVFQKYFRKECIEKTLWIHNNRTYELDKIAKFSDCKNNFNFLIEIYNDKESHYRTRYSALEVLAYFRIPDGQLEALKEWVIVQIKDVKNESNLKAQIVRFINSQEELFTDKPLINEVFKIFEKETNKEINTALLSLVNSFDNVEAFSSYIVEEFLRAHNLKKRDEEDEVGRGNSYKSQNLIIRLESSTDFLEVLKYYFIDHANLHYNEDFAKELLDRCIYFSGKDKDFVIRLLSSITEHHRFSIHERFLSRIVLECNSKTESLLYLLRNEEFKHINLFASNFVDFDNIEEVVQIISEKEIDQKEIEGFRNMIGNNNHFDRRIAVEFDKLMREKGVVFKKEVYTDEKRDLNTQNHLNNIQRQLNILFDKDELLKEINLVFKKTTNEVLTWGDISKIRNKWYDVNGHGNVLIDSALDVIDAIMPRNNYKLKFEEVEKIVNQETILFFELKELIEKCKRSQWEFKLLDKHKEIIIEWCIETSTKIDFNNIIRLHRRSSFSYVHDNYKKIELIFYFQNLIGFELGKEFLLNCIEFHQFERTTKIDEGFENLKLQINDEIAFNNKIVDNIINKELFSFSLSKHIEYALNNNLTKAFIRIREFFKEDDSIYNETNKIEKYIELSGDQNLLLECCSDPKSRLYWTSIKIMLKLGINKDFCLDKSIEYINSEEVTFKSNALENLFKLNDIRAIEYLVDSAERKNLSSIRMIQYANYNAFKDYDIIERLFNLIYSKEFDRLEYGDYSSFLKTYISNLSVEEEKYNSIIDLLLNIKKRLKDYGADLFYINLLIDDVSDSYINSQSNVFNFEEAFKRMNELID